MTSRAFSSHLQAVAVPDSLLQPNDPSEVPTLFPVLQVSPKEERLSGWVNGGGRI